MSTATKATVPATAMPAMAPPLNAVFLCDVSLCTQLGRVPCLTRKRCDVAFVPSASTPNTANIETPALPFAIQATELLVREGNRTRTDSVEAPTVILYGGVPPIQ